MPQPESVTIADIVAAEQRLAGVVHKTPALIC